MGTYTRKRACIIHVLLLALFLTALPIPSHAAAKLTINLQNNQTFYLLPGTDRLDYKVTVSGDAVGDMTCSSSNLTVANIDNMGNLSINDAGSAKITVAVGSKKITRTIQVLRRSDWTRALSIKNRTKLTVKDNVCTVKIKNEMDFPLKTVLHYDTIADSGSTILTDQKTQDIYLPAGGSLSYKFMLPDGITAIRVTNADFVYQQYGLKSISAKKVTVKESTAKKDSKTKILTESISNKNKNGIILPYHLYLYDKNNKLISVEYRSLKLAGKQKESLSYTYTIKDSLQDSYVAKVKYKFETPIPFF